MAMALDGPRLGPASGGSADSLVVLVHGYGADGRDLFDLAPIWARDVPGAAFVAPHAPFVCADSPMGRQWFPLWDRSEGQLVAGVQEAAAMLGACVRAEMDALGLAEGRVALAGFSQGAMLVLQAGLQGEVANPAAILAYSGALLGAPSAVSARPRVLIAHGLNDAVVPVQAGIAAAERLTSLGLHVEMLLREGLDHGLDEEGVRAGGRILAAALCG